MSSFKNKNFFFIIFISAFWFSFEFIILGPYSYVTMFDMGDIHIPLNFSVNLDFDQFGITYWNKNQATPNYLVCGVLAAETKRLICCPYIIDRIRYI